MLKPLCFDKDSAGTALVELKEKGDIETPDKQFKSFSRGLVVGVTNKLGTLRGVNILDKYIGKEVFFEEYSDTAQVEEDDILYAFIPLEKIKGYKDAES